MKCSVNYMCSVVGHMVDANDFIPGHTCTYILINDPERYDIYVQCARHIRFWNIGSSNM